MSDTSEIETGPAPFDFPAHRLEALDSYRKVRGLYEGLSNVIREVLRAAIPRSYPIHSIEARAKDLDSFLKKAIKPLDDDPTHPRYPEPLKQITDLAGIRVITFFPRTLSAVNECVEAQFEVLEKMDKSEELIEAERFGYQSIHYLVKLKATRTVLPEYQRYQDLVAEIQLRTILQHAWAEMEHDIQYKSVAAIPAFIRRRFMSLAGMLEIADREFQTIQDEDERHRAAVRDTIEKDLEEVIDLRPVVAELEARIRDLQEVKRPTTTYLPGSARALVDKGYYDEAIKAYDLVIERHPYVYNNYIQRGKARFLAGDRAGALDDLRVAEDLYPYDPTIERVRQQIMDGTAPLTSAAPIPYQEASAGNQELAHGNADSAFSRYKRAEELGWHPSYSRFNQAMALCLRGDTEDALLAVKDLRPPDGSYMEINVAALETICQIENGEPHQPLILKLQEMEGLHRFDFSKSPLRYLEVGLKATERHDRAAGVFFLLRSFGGEPTDES